MKFTLTPVESQNIARAAAKHFIKKGFSVKSEKPLSDAAPYRTTLLAEKGAYKILIEAQSNISYGERLIILAQYLFANRLNCGFYLATNYECLIPLKIIGLLKRDGVGLLGVHGKDHVEHMHEARNPALVITPDPTLTYGDKTSQVRKLIERFNQGERKDALRDMFELMEGFTEEVVLKAARKGYISKTRPEILALDWNNKIDILRAKSAKNGNEPLISNTLRNDLHSFRSGRNLLDHRAVGRHAEFQRECQFGDRMMTGARLVTELISAKNRLK
jgi:hypothetical protein